MSIIDFVNIGPFTVFFDDSNPFFEWVVFQNFNDGPGLVKVEEFIINYWIDSETIDFENLSCGTVPNFNHVKSCDGTNRVDSFNQNDVVWGIDENQLAGLFNHEIPTFAPLVDNFDLNFAV